MSSDSEPYRTFVFEPMRALERAAHRDVVAQLAEAGYPGVRQPHVKLLAYVPRGEGIRMSALAERLELTKGAVTQLVTYLEGLGLVERVPDPDDGRAVIVRPTAAAHRGYEVARQRLAEIEEAWEARVGPRRWAAFRKTLLELSELPGHGWPAPAADDVRS